MSQPSLIHSSCYLSLVPLPIPSTGSVSRSASRFCFPVLSPGSVSQFRLPVPLLILITIPFPFLFTSPFTFPFHLRLHLRSIHRSIYRSDSRQRHRVLAAKGRIANRKPVITGKFCSDTDFSARKCVSQTGNPSLPTKNCNDTGFSPQKSVSRTGWAQKSVWHGNSVPRAIQVGFRRAP